MHIAFFSKEQFMVYSYVQYRPQKYFTNHICTSVDESASKGENHLIMQR